MTILASVNNKTVMPGITPIADVPDAPTIGTATAAGLEASITFTEATTGGTPTTFTATSNPGSITGTASSSPVTVSGLTADTSYTFTVTAGNSTGTSLASAASNSITAVSPISGGYDSLATVIVPSGGLSSIVFAGIPSGYKHLQMRIFGFQTTSNDVFLKLNSNAGVRKHRLTGNGSTASAGADTGTASGLYLGNIGWDATYPTVDIIDILDASNTNKYKTVRNLGGTDKNGSGTVFLESYLFDDTAAVSSITITGASSFASNSSFALYGVK